MHINYDGVGENKTIVYKPITKIDLRLNANLKVVY